MAAMFSLLGYVNALNRYSSERFPFSGIVGYLTEGFRFRKR